MQSLINIRIKYLLRNPCLLFWSYLFLPIIILLISIYCLYKGSKKWEIIPKGTPLKIDEKYFFKDNLSYEKLYNYLEVTLIIADSQINCDKITNYFRQNNIIENINCSISENNITNLTANIIEIKKEKGNYRIYLTSRQSETSPYYFFNKEDLSQEKITDVFYTNNNDKNDTNNQILYDKFEIFWELQSLLSKIIIELENKQVDQDFKMSLGYNPYPEHYPFTNEYGSSTYSFLSFIIALQFSLISYNFNLRMIDEKESKLNILLERQGISKFKYYTSWLITFYALSALSIIAFLLLIFIYIKFHHLIAFIILILFSLGIFSVCTFFTTCIKSAKAGATAVKFYNFGSILLGFVIVLPQTAKFTKIFFSFIPQINLYQSLCCIFSLNNFENLTLERLWLKAAKISFWETFIMYLVEIIFYLGLSFIIQKFLDSGLSFFQYIKSFFTKVSRNINNSSNDIENKENLKFEIHHQELSPINQEKKNLNQCLKLMNISKSFGDLKAVNNFNGELFPNEIFCLLGHNGAGKSTTINMISGIIDPDEGDILLNGRSLVTDKNYLYQNIGLCQQEDIFFDFLTVEEHLEYMCKIKGSQVNTNEIQDLIKKIELFPKKDALCNTLSGGQKRKLCIALALIGGSKIILLDEPTSGMDVMSRRSLWEFLKNYKNNKIILLTTHFLDEAEYLGDRIGIMSDGQFLCSGTSSYLKLKYPCGFNINLLINSSIFNEDYKQQFYNEILKYEKEAEIKVCSRGIFSINIQSNNSHISEIFNYIEQIKEQFGIEDYTVSSTSLEDVFLKINNKGNLNDLKYLNKEDNNEFQDNNIDPITVGFCSQLRAQIIRGLYPLWRNKLLFFFELLSGLGFVYIFIFFFSDFIINSNTTKLNLVDVLKTNNIYIYEKSIKEDFLKKSDLYSNLGKSITFKKIKEKPENIEDFMSLAYDQSFANIAKGAIYVDGTNPKLYEVYNSEVNTGLNGYFYANTIIFVSAFLKNNYNIDVTIFPEIEYNSISGDAATEGFVNILSDSLVLIIVCLISLFGFVVFLGGLMFEKIKEKRTNIKHLLYLSGSNIWSYWFGFYVVDYLKLLFFTIFLIFPIYFVNGAASYFGLNMLAINLSSLSFIYFISFFCSKDDEGAKILFLVIFGFLIIIMLLGKVLDNKVLEYISSFTRLYIPNIIDLTPVTSMGLSFIRIIISYSIFVSLDKLTEYLGIDFQINEFSGLHRPKEYLFTSYIAQILNFILYTLLLMLAESGLLEKLIHCIELILYMKKEKNYIENPFSSEENMTMSNNSFIKINNNEIYQNQNNQYENNNNNNVAPNNQNSFLNAYVMKEINKIKKTKELSTRISGLTKTFFSCCGKRKVRAINNFYLGLEPNEKFGLLGFNGSGKTTTFRAITNEILIDSGSITLFGYNTKTQFERIRTIIGYCPQINPLFDYMKVKEIIKFYSNLKTCNESVESICKKFGLSKYLDSYTINLSGGNKRKLTFAIAMMNRPRLLLLDEPSTGVDPESRRIMWKNINELSNSGHKYNMILTTHSMEEAEVLCDTVAWFKAGNFIAKGNPEELKIQYSAGYKLHIKFVDQIINRGNISNSINEVFNDICILIEGFNLYAKYILSNPDLEPYLKGLIKIAKKIKDKTQKISLNLIGQDLSFELIISIIKEKQKVLFIEVLNMKNTDNSIDEMSISMQSLENILTSLN